IPRHLYFRLTTSPWTCASYRYGDIRSIWRKSSLIVPWSMSRLTSRVEPICPRRPRRHQERHLSVSSTSQSDVSSSTRVKFIITTARHVLTRRFATSKRRPHLILQKLDTPAP